MRVLCCSAAVCLLFLGGCYYDNEEELYPAGSNPCDTSKVTYTATVEPFVQENCVSCHNDQLANGNVRLDGYDFVKAAALTGPLYPSVSYSAGAKEMPPSGKLSDCSIKQIKAWIDAGAPQ